MSARSWTPCAAHQLCTCPQSSPALPRAGFHTAVKPHEAQGWLTPEHGDIAAQELERLQRGSVCRMLAIGTALLIRGRSPKP